MDFSVRIPRQFGAFRTAQFVANYVLFSWNFGTIDSQFTIEQGDLAKAKKEHDLLYERESSPEEDRATLHALRVWEDNALLYYHAVFHNCNDVAYKVFEMHKKKK